MRTVAEHATLKAEWLGERKGMLEMRRMYGGYFKGFAGAEPPPRPRHPGADARRRHRAPPQLLRSRPCPGRRRRRPRRHGPARHHPRRRRLRPPPHADADAERRRGDGLRIGTADGGRPTTSAAATCQVPAPDRFATGHGGVFASRGGRRPKRRLYIAAHRTPTPMTASEFRSSPWALVAVMVVLAVLVLVIRTSTGM